MASLVTALDTTFTPAAGDFIVQVTKGEANLVRQNAAGLDFVLVGPCAQGAALIVSNPIAGAIYKFVSSNNATVRADQ
jgi:hypothetical protein